MRMGKYITLLLSMLTALVLVMTVAELPVAATDGNGVTATTSATIQQGNTGYCYVYIDSTEELAALDIAVHFDSSKIKPLNAYNSITAQVYDISVAEDSVYASYILDGEGANTKTRLFYFSYQVLNTADTGKTYFDIVVGETYAIDLTSVEVSGSRCSFEIKEKTAQKSCTISSNSAISTSVAEEFTISYRLNTYQIAAGSATITYDPQLFDALEVKAGGFLNGKIADVNFISPGRINLSFVGTEYGTKYDLITVKFKTIKNTTETSSIDFNVIELYDIDLNPVSCKTCTTNAKVEYDDEYTGDAPSMSVSAKYDKNTNKVLAVVTLAKDSMLGAGDFALGFDAKVLKLISATKGFEPDYFYINDKNAANGVLKFSILSTEDITDAYTVLTAEFEVVGSCDALKSAITLSGSGLTDSLTETIALNILGCDVDLNEKHSYTAWKVTVAATPDSYGTEARSCSTCGHIETRQISKIAPLSVSSVSLTLHDDLTINLKADQGVIENTGWSEPYLVVNFNGAETVINRYTVSGGKYTFKFTNIAPYLMDEKITATIYATYNGKVYKGTTVEYSIAHYCYAVLGKYTADAYAELRTLMVDLLNYGAAAQNYKGHNTEMLVNARLTDLQKSWATPTVSELISALDAKYEVIDAPTVSWKSAGLFLEESVTMRFKISADSIDGLTAKISGAGYNWTIPASEFKSISSGGYYIYFSGFNAAQMREPVYITIYDGDIAVSNTLKFSIETYAYMQQNTTDTKLAALLDTMMKYGDSAYNYVH